MLSPMLWSFHKHQRQVNLQNPFTKWYPSDQVVPFPPVPNMPPLKRPLLQDHEDIWQQREDEIRELYQVRRKTLKEVKDTMEGRGFPQMPLSTWETRLRDNLQVRKKFKGNDWPRVYRHVLPRLQRPGKKKLKRPTGIYLDGTAVPWEKAWKEMRRSGVLSRSPRQGPLSPLPTYISVRTPSPLQSPVLSVGCTRSPSPFMLESQAHQLDEIDSVTSQIAGLWPSADDFVIGFTPNDFMVDYTLDVTTDDHTLTDFMVNSTQNDHKVAAATHLETFSLSLMCHRLPWLQVSRALRGYFSVESLIFFNSAEEVGIPLYMIPSSLAAYAEYETGLCIKELLDAAADTAMIQSFDVFHYMSASVYLLSNHLAGIEGEELTSLLETLSEHIPNRLLREILKIPLPAMRAAWEFLIRSEATVGFKSLFNLLVDVGIQNDWLNVVKMGHDYLFYAVRARCFDAMQKLLARGCRADFGWLHEKDSAILKAIQSGHIEAAKLLLRYCNVNRTFSIYEDPYNVGRSTNFMVFMHQYNKDDPSHRRGLKLFLEHGANLEAPWFDSPFEPRENPAMLEFFKRNKICLSLWPTILDYYFYADRSIYREMQPYEESDTETLLFVRNQSNWRSNILRALEKDDMHIVNLYANLVDRNIEQYRQGKCWRAQHPSTPRWLQQCIVDQRYDQERHPAFELLFSEQLLFGEVWYKDKSQPRQIDWGLIALHVDLNIPSLPKADLTELLCAALAVIPQSGGMSPGMEISLGVFCSLHEHSVNWSNVFLEVVRTNNMEVTSLLSEKAPSPGENGEAALIEAARLQNYQAVDWLLALGVNIWSLAEVENHSVLVNGPVASTRSGVSNPQPKVFLSSQMVEFLSGKGLHLDPKAECCNPFQKLSDLFKQGSTKLLQRAKPLLDEMWYLQDQESDSACMPAYLLELCLRGPDPWKERQQRLELFEYCFRRGAQLSAGSPLSVLIYAGGRTELIEELLDKGAEVNAYSHDMESEFPELPEPWCLSPLQAAALCGNELIVHKLLERGADVNAPALGRLGKTALQSICVWIPSTSEERARKNRIVYHLLEHGADVNALPAENCGRTALQIAAAEGELDLVALLLDRGADVNAPPCPKKGWTALDSAAFHGRLDVVKVLLNSGARSLYGGSTGYSSAVECAEHRGHFAVAELIAAHLREFP